jgi:hypothetical protein
MSLMLEQDPHDEIIRHPSALQTGIANVCLLNNWSSLIPEEDIIYKQAHYYQLDSALPNQDRMGNMLSQVTNISSLLSIEFIQHFYGCCKAIMIQSLLSASSLSNSNASNNTSSTNAGTASGEKMDEEQPLLHRKQVGNSANSSGSHRSLSNKHLHRVEENRWEEDNDDEDDVESKSTQDPDSIGPHSQSNISNTNSTLSSDHSGDTTSTSSSVPFHGRGKIEEYLAFNVQKDSYFHGKLLTIPQKVAIVIVRIDNGTGYWLGHALQSISTTIEVGNAGIDQVQTWLVNYLLWNTTPAPTSSTHPGRKPNASAIPQAIEDLQHLSDHLYPYELQEKHTIQFLLQALKCLNDRHQYIQYYLQTMGNESGTVSGEAEGSGKGIGGSSSASAVELMKRRGVPWYGTIDLRGNPMTPLPSLSTPSTPTATVGSSSAGISSDTNDGNGGVVMTDMRVNLTRRKIGELLTVHCGHNGWLPNSDLDRFAQWLSRHQLLQAPPATIVVSSTTSS